MTAFGSAELHTCARSALGQADELRAAIVAARARCAAVVWSGPAARAFAAHARALAADGAAIAAALDTVGTRLAGLADLLW